MNDDGLRRKGHSALLELVCLIRARSTFALLVRAELLVDGAIPSAIVQAVIVCWLLIQKVFIARCFIMFIGDGCRVQIRFFHWQDQRLARGISMVYGRTSPILNAVNSRIGFIAAHPAPAWFR